MMKDKPVSVVMLGASGAVGSHALKALLGQENIDRITLLGRTPVQVPATTGITIEQHKIDIFDSSSYRSFISDHTVAICTLGVGEPSKVSKEEFIKIDKTAVIDFAKACKAAGVRHFEILSSVGVSTSSSSFYLRTKGELNEALEALHFDRLSIFQPSMILTPENRYGFSQAVVLKVWPLLKPLLRGSLKKYRGVPVDILGRSMALNIFSEKEGVEKLQWGDFYRIGEV